MIICTDKIWPRDESGFVNITIGLYNPLSLYSRDTLAVKAIAKEWEDAVPRLRFEWRTAPGHNIQSCNVRIKFTPRCRSWSCAGTDAIYEDRLEPTMELKPFDLSNPDRWKGTVRHEFGHMLGAVHEQKSPEFPWDFNHAEIEKRDDPLENLQVDILFRPRPSDEVMYSGFDDKSIMLYHIQEAELTQRDERFPPRKIDTNFEISEIDKGFMRMVYDSSGSYINSNNPSNSSSALATFPVDFFSPVNNLCGDPNCIPGGPTMCARDLNRLTNICGNPECGAGGTTLCKGDLDRIVQLLLRESNHPNCGHLEAQSMYSFSANLYNELSKHEVLPPLCKNQKCGPCGTFICMQDFNRLTNTCGNPNCGPGGHAVCVADSERVTRQLENICGNPNCGINGTFFCLADKERIYPRV